MLTLTKKDLIELGYGPTHSAKIIKEAKNLMIAKGHTYYLSRKLDRVPCEAVEKVLGIKLNNQNTMSNMHSNVNRKE